MAIKFFRIISGISLIVFSQLMHAHPFHSEHGFVIQEGWSGLFEVAFLLIVVFGLAAILKTSQRKQVEYFKSHDNPKSNQNKR